MTRRPWFPHLLAALSLVYLVVMLVTGARPQQGQFVPYEAAGILRQNPRHVSAVEIRADEARYRLVRAGRGWRLGDRALSPAAAETLELALKLLHATRPVRLLRGPEIDLRDAQYGLDRPLLVVRIEVASGQGADASQPMVMASGGLSADGALRYVRVEDRTELVLMSPFVIEAWEALREMLASPVGFEARAPR